MSTDETDATETFSVREIREAFAAHASNDDWGVPSFYEDVLIAALRGEYGCLHRFPDGTRCTLAADAHTEVPGLSAVHGYPPAEQVCRPGTPGDDSR